MADKRVILSDPLTQDRLFPAVISDNIFNADGTPFDLEGLKTSVSEGKSLIAAAVTDKGVETAADATFQTMAENIRKIQSIITIPIGNLGTTVTFDGEQWIIVHIDNAKHIEYLAHTNIVRLSKFGSTVIYSQSKLRNAAKEFENNMSQAARSVMVDVTVEDVTAKVFVASYAQMNGGFSWFNSNTRRICKYGNNIETYWTSTSGQANTIKIVSTDGDFGASGSGPTGTHGFRPCIALPI